MNSLNKIQFLCFVIILSFHGNIFGQQWLGSLTNTGITYRNGTVSTNQHDETGFAVSAPTHKSDWGGLWYGISQGNSYKFNLANLSNNQWVDPVLVQGFWGLGFRTDKGKMTMGRNGVVTIGLNDTKIVSISEEPYWHNYKLYVGGGIRTERVLVDLQNNWPDYVFEKNYSLRSIESVANFIRKNKHLPNIPSAKEIKDNGIDLGEMDAKLLRQIEELWLHMIDVKKENKHLKVENEYYKSIINQLVDDVESLKNK